MYISIYPSIHLSIYTFVYLPIHIYTHIFLSGSSCEGPVVLFKRGLIACSSTPIPFYLRGRMEWGSRPLGTFQSPREASGTPCCSPPFMASPSGLLTRKKMYKTMCYVASRGGFIEQLQHDHRLAIMSPGWPANLDTRSHNCPRKGILSCMVPKPATYLQRWLLIPRCFDP